jgi:hypothetical protein
VLNGRIYRAAFLPLLLALAVAGFSLTARPAPLGSDLAPDAFEGARAYATLQELARRFPERRPGSAGDNGLAAYVAATLRGLGAAGKGGFAVSTRAVNAQTIDGERTLSTVIARRAGTSGGTPIAIVAHRDAAGVGARAELSGTVALLELARVLAASETRHPIVLVSTSGGSGGTAGASDFAAHASRLLGEEGGGEGGGVVAGEPANAGQAAGGPVDAALVLGDLAGARASTPALAAFSAGPGMAPVLLQSTVAQALAQEAGLSGAGPGTLAQLAHLAFPLAGGEQAPLDAHGVPAVLVGVGGEREPPAGEPVSTARLEGMGRAVLAAVYALDGAPTLAGLSGGAPETGLGLAHGKALPAWALRLLVAALLLPALLAILDGLARLRRRRVPVGRWVVWTLACALPFAVCAVLAIMLGALGAIPAPTPPVSGAALPFDRQALEVALVCALALVLAWLSWPAAMRRLRLPIRPEGEAPALGMLLVLGGLSVVAWACDPLAALLLAPALHLWLALTDTAEGERPLVVAAASTALAERGGRGVGAGGLRAAGLVALGVAPVALLMTYYAVRLQMGVGGTMHTALLLLAGGRVGLAGALLWSAGCGCAAAALLVAIAPAAKRPVGNGPGEFEDWWQEPASIAPIRGPLSYAGPGSLGGTESALRR